MNEYSLRIADDGTNIVVSSTEIDGVLTVFFQRLNIDTEAISVEVEEVTETGAILAPFPVSVTAPQEATIHQALVELLVV